MHKLQDAAKRLAAEIHDVPTVVSVGITEIQRKPALTVLVDHIDPQTERRIPKKFEGLTVDTVVTGEIETL